MANVVSVEVLAPKSGDLGISWVDWTPTPRDKDMGLWQEVVLRTSRAVTGDHPFVETKLDLPKAEIAHLTVRASLSNALNSPVKGTLRGQILDGGLSVAFSQEVELAAHEAKEITFSPETIPGLNLLRPKLWWPYQMVEPFLHTLTLQFAT